VSGRPAPVVLDDLVDPRFTPEFAQLRETLVDVAPACPLEPDALCTAAAEETGLGDFGNGDFRGRLDVLCRALGDEAGLSPSGVVTWYSQLVQLLKNRLLIEDLLSRHPEIHDLESDRSSSVASRAPAPPIFTI
jgi:hypothetical protein